MKFHKSIFFLIILLISIFSISIQIYKVKANPDKIITYDATNNIITAINSTEENPITFNDLWLADKAGVFSLQDRDNITGIDFSTVLVTNDLRPTDYGYLGGINVQDLYITIENWVNMTSAEIRVRGKDRIGTIVLEDIFVTSNGNYYTSKLFAEVVYTEVITFVGSGSFDYELIQGQWGVIWKTGENQFMFECRIVIGDGSTTTYFTDKEVQIIFNNVFTGSWQNAIYVYNYAHLIFGEVVDETNKITKNGISIINIANYGNSYLIRGQGSSYTYFEAYSCIFQSTDRSYIYYLGNAKIWHTIFTINIGLMVAGDYYDVVIANQAESGMDSVTGTFDTITIEKCRYALTLRWSTELILNNVKIRNIDLYEFYARNRYANVYLINFDSDNWRFLFTVDSTGEWYRQYTFNIKITWQNGSNIENANVTISNDYLNISNSWLTYSNGSIPEQIYSMGHYNYTGGNNIYDYNPYNLTVTYGSLTYTKLFNITEPIKWQIAIGQQTTEAIEELKAIGLIIIVISLFCCLIAITIYGGKKKNEI